ncbi:hypothetical protein [Rubinisphaera italica]|uniref:Uncharacterized protein n=1 Tax=Rubinisphaera italica TaxID=2527969 RepID=A0A5C5XPJ5_9PLAN|nr:hypothetical protein [Rubinisphaera italica]TWT64381.1 hypothetical protein Pan54_51430 [Rubinisphaera italica]
MKSIQNIDNNPIGVPLTADELLEFHAARLLLLFRVCGTAGRIDGLTKMAKLDFFVRYPEFFDKACKTLGLPAESATQSVESSMIRFHYGPWDDRYYHVLAYLESRELLSVTKDKKTFNLSLTARGVELAKTLASDDSFHGLVEQMKRVKKALGSKAGSTLKKLVYQVFDKEVAERRMGETIE